MWVQNAKRDHFDFMSKMRDRGVEVVELHEVLAETMENAEAKSWLLDRKIIANEVGPGFVKDTACIPGQPGCPDAHQVLDRRPRDR